MFHLLYWNTFTNTNTITKFIYVEERLQCCGVRGGLGMYFHITSKIGHQEWHTTQGYLFDEDNQWNARKTLV